MFGYVYLIHDTNFYKIGHTDRNPKLRLQEAQIYNPFELTLVYTHKTLNYKKIEYLLHRRFHIKHIRGEWFNLTFEDVNNFKPLCEKLENEIKVLSENPFVM